MRRPRGVPAAALLDSLAVVALPSGQRARATLWRGSYRRAGAIHAARWVETNGKVVRYSGRNLGKAWDGIADRLAEQLNDTP